MKQKLQLKIKINYFQIEQHNYSEKKNTQSSIRK